jgi:ABC-type antimicrobial peptide transport system permease subunit
MNRQSKKFSLIEAITNALVGLLVSWLFTFFILPLFGLAMTYQIAIWITASFFLLSTIRAYLLRRFFNWVSK